jgi:hypothetical protein
MHIKFEEFWFQIKTVTDWSFTWVDETEVDYQVKRYKLQCGICQNIVLSRGDLIYKLDQIELELLQHHIKWGWNARSSKES